MRAFPAVGLLLTTLAALGCSSREVIGSSYRPSNAAGASTAGSNSGGGSGIGGSGGSAGLGGALGMPLNESSYDEPYRGQFHFSPPSMWMGAIDGLWYDAGTFHLAYQVDPYAFVQGQDEHWGHATSPDLLHWQHQPYLLAPGVNVVGSPWVGSVVVDTNNSAGFQTGDQPAHVAIFTDTGAGTSVAFSNDRGQTWQAYSESPVAIGDADYQSNRDPLVLWHEPTQQWVCAYWQNGITFYTSPDLKTWTQRGNVAWGDLVPDLYELAVDGNESDRRWVLQDASGAYLLGDFDGQTFVQSAGPFSMDSGPDLYSARTAFRATFPGQRAVQMAWLRNGNVPTAPARGDATFPVELGLKTFPEGVRLTRTPIAEIEQLYGSTRHFDAQLLEQERNLLAGIEAKSFDFEIELDDVETQPNEIRLQIADKLIVYDWIDQTLMGLPLGRLDGRLKLRVLADRGQLEIFANDGQFSYSESFGFAPDDASLSLDADGPLAIVSADFREVGRIWPGSAAHASQVVDDTSPDVTYLGDWQSLTGDATFVGETCHVSAPANAALELTFTGTRVVWYGLVNTDLGMANLYLDGALVAENLDAYAARRAPVQLFARDGLPNTFHTLRIEATGQKNPASSGSALVHDYFVTAVQP
jgi:fructan beta-fructosidase